MHKTFIIIIGKSLASYLLAHSGDVTLRGKCLINMIFMEHRPGPIGPFDNRKVLKELLRFG